MVGREAEGMAARARAGLPMATAVAVMVEVVRAEGAGEVVMRSEVVAHPRGVSHSPRHAPDQSLRRVAVRSHLPSINTMLQATAALAWTDRRPVAAGTQPPLRIHVHLQQLRR